LEGAVKRFATEVQLVLYPFVLNATSEVATQAAWCAGEQGKFWEFHRMLYARQTEWYRLPNPLDRLLEFAKDLQVDTAALQSCVRSGRMQRLIEADKDYGRSLQVHSTPTLFINDQRIVGAHSEADLVRTIRRELGRAQRSAS
jgi:protein-disulfide isomerase